MCSVSLLVWSLCDDELTLGASVMECNVSCFRVRRERHLTLTHEELDPANVRVRVGYWLKHINCGVTMIPFQISHIDVCLEVIEHFRLMQRIFREMKKRMSFYWRVFRKDDDEAHEMLRGSSDMKAQCIQGDEESY